MDKDLVKLGVAGCVIFVVLSGVCVAGALWIHRRAAETTAADEPSESPPRAPSKPPRAPKKKVASDDPVTPQRQAAKAATPSHDVHDNRTLSRPIRVKDRTHVEVTELFQQAAAIANELQPGAKFYGADAWGLQHGTLDLDRLDTSTRTSFDFEYGGLDSTQPPGKDKFEVRIDVSVSTDELVARASSGGAIHLHSEEAFGGELPADPRCTAKRAFESGVASGVPDNAIARLIYQDNHHFTPQDPLVWSLRVEGHDEYRREISAVTCAVVKNWGASTGSDRAQRKAR